MNLANGVSVSFIFLKNQFMISLFFSIASVFFFLGGSLFYLSPFWSLLFPFFCWLWDLFVLFLIPLGGGLDCLFEIFLFLEESLYHYKLPSWTAFAVSIDFGVLCFQFHLSWGKFWFLLWFPHWPWFFSRMLFSLHVCSFPIFLFATDFLFHNTVVRKKYLI